ncbi:hypothetical protein Purlil1_6755 [Purpureocillium lilacinum]|uniref:Uncharacterized protein n=1 Tax=Purpureocillium lilacinum TaxID=33203 RepID=A0ABR0BYD6_PURLI|nr:hypothetical protein Purlil1_6755 [Purpureocillium lilacinum]
MDAVQLKTQWGTALGLSRGRSGTSATPAGPLRAGAANQPSPLQGAGPCHWTAVAPVDLCDFAGGGTCTSGTGHQSHPSGTPSPPRGFCHPLRRWNAPHRPSPIPDREMLRHRAIHFARTRRHVRFKFECFWMEDVLQLVDHVLGVDRTCPWLIIPGATASLERWPLLVTGVAGAQSRKPMPSRGT